MGEQAVLDRPKELSVKAATPGKPKLRVAGNYRDC
jgi:hypothetical protein